MIKRALGDIQGFKNIADGSAGVALRCKQVFGSVNDFSSTLAMFFDDAHILPLFINRPTVGLLSSRQFQLRQQTWAWLHAFCMCSRWRHIKKEAPKKNSEPPQKRHVRLCTRRSIICRTSTWDRCRCGMPGSSRPRPCGPPRRGSGLGRPACAAAPDQGRLF